MRLAQLVAHWPWLVGYVAVASVIFVWLRRSGSTDALADHGHVADGFGPADSLGAIAAEFLSLSGPRLLLLTLLVSGAARLSVGRWSLWDAVTVSAVVAFWPVQEWLIHVFLLHAKPFTLLGLRLDPIVARNHRNHHRNPWDPLLGITPAHMIWLYIAGLPGVWLLVLPVPQALSGVAVYFVLALNYEWVHYLIHTSYVPRGWYYRRLWMNHRLHHFKNEQYWYGVTMLSADWLLLTQPKAQQANRSETCLTLGVGREDGTADARNRGPHAEKFMSLGPSSRLD